MACMLSVNALNAITLAMYRSDLTDDCTIADVSAMGLKMLRFLDRRYWSILCPNM